MSTEADGKKMRQVFLEYKEGKKVNETDKPMLDRLVMASYIEYTLVNGEVFAKASPIAKGL
ncbi:MAG: hypothetical protein FWC44_02300 [Methanomassiliicoccaceae archaeon]|nr:hypothetical protein [Methanomassiliicoccaceae archaeon]